MVARRKRDANFLGDGISDSFLFVRKRGKLQLPSFLMESILDCYFLGAFAFAGCAGKTIGSIACCIVCSVVSTVLGYSFGVLCAAAY